MRTRLGEQLSPETAGITFETAGISPENNQISQGRNPAGSHSLHSLALARGESYIISELDFLFRSASVLLCCESMLFSQLSLEAS